MCGMRVFSDKERDFATVVVDSDIDFTIVSSSQWVLCLWWAEENMFLHL